jgi:O-antigen ligase
MEIGLMTQLVFFALCIACAVATAGRSAERVLCVAILGGAGLLVLQFWTTRTLYLYENKWFSWTSPFLEFANVRFFSQYQAYTLFILPLCVVMFNLKRWQRYGVYFIAANFWALQWLVGTRAVWVGLLIAVVAVLAFARGGRLRWLTQQALLILAGAAIYIGYLVVVPQVTRDAPTVVKNSLIARGTNSIDARIIMARKAIDYVQERPLTGVGPGQFGLTYRETLAAHPHNSALQLLSEYGLIAGGAALGVAVLLLALAVSRLKPPQAGASDPIDIGLSAALLMGLGDSLFSGNIIMPHAQILLSLLSGWILARATLSGGAPAALPPGSGGKVRMVLIYPVLLAWAVTMILGLEYWDVTHTFPSWLSDRPPHFWQYGRLDNW